MLFCCDSGDISNHFAEISAVKTIVNGLDNFLKVWRWRKVHK